jgi:hypothetical protein
MFADSYMDSPSVVQRLFHSDWNVWFVLVYRQTKANMLTLMPKVKLFLNNRDANSWLIDHDILTLQRTIGLVLTHSSFH